MLIGAGAAVVLLLVVVISSVMGGSDYSVPNVSANLNEEDEEKWKEGIKAAGESYIEFLEEKVWERTEVEMGFEEDEYERAEELSAFYQDEKKYKEGLKRQKNRLDFFVPGQV